MSERVKLPDSTQLDTLNGKLESINTTLAGQEFVTKDNIVSALGYEPEKPEGNYELIKSVTTTEDSVLLVITEDSNGKAFELAHGYICITCPSTLTTARNGGIYWRGKSDDGTLSVSMYTKLFTGNTGKVYYWVHNRGSYVETFYEAMNSGNSNADSTAIFSKPFSNPHINEARLYMENIIPAGATIELYAIRA